MKIISLIHIFQFFFASGSSNQFTIVILWTDPIKNESSQMFLTNKIIYFTLDFTCDLVIILRLTLLETLERVPRQLSAVQLQAGLCFVSNEQ